MGFFEDTVVKGKAVVAKILAIPNLRPGIYVDIAGFAIETIAFGDGVALIHPPGDTKPGMFLGANVAVDQVLDGYELNDDIFFSMSNPQNVDTIRTAIALDDVLGQLTSEEEVLCGRPSGFAHDVQHSDRTEAFELATVTYDNHLRLRLIHANADQRSQFVKEMEKRGLTKVPAYVIARSLCRQLDGAALKL